MHAKSRISSVYSSPGHCLVGRKIRHWPFLHYEQTCPLAIASHTGKAFLDPCQWKPGVLRIVGLWSFDYTTTTASLPLFSLATDRQLMELVIETGLSALLPGGYLYRLLQPNLCQQFWCICLGRYCAPQPNVNRHPDQHSTMSTANSNANSNDLGRKDL